jgi:GDP-L-fucose synthase
MNPNSKIYVAGHRGLVGSAIVRALRTRGYNNLVVATHHDIDLTDPVQVKWFFSVHNIEYVFMCAAKVGGIKANEADPLNFFLENMDIEKNVICNAAYYGVKKLVFLGSSCIYPKHCPQPIKEEYLMTGPIEPTTEAYALAKIAGLRLCQWLRQSRGCNFVTAMPCNLYGPGDNFGFESSHIIPGMIARMHAAKLSGAPFDVWGDGLAKREFLFSEDLAEALLRIMDEYNDPEPINTGSGDELTVGQLAGLIARVIDYRGEIRFDASQPVGTPRKVLDNTKIFNLGWAPRTNLTEGLRITYEDFIH